jgi:hypothetical protein
VVCRDGENGELVGAAREGAPLAMHAPGLWGQLLADFEAIAWEIDAHYVLSKEVRPNVAVESALVESPEGELESRL